MLKALGIDPKDMFEAAAEMATKLEATAQALHEDMDCLKETAAAQLRVLEYEYGLPVQAIPGHDPRRLPYVEQLNATDDTPARVNFMTVLNGKPATRGHVSNIGDAKAKLFFVAEDLKVGGQGQAGPYILLPGATLELSWAAEIIRVETAGDGAVSVQVFGQ